MSIIDFHTHIYPEKIAERATVAIGNFYNLQMERVGTIDNLLKAGQRAGVERFVVHSVATSGAQVEKINDFIAAEVKAHPGTVYGFGTLHQDYENKTGEVDRCIALGLKGIKLHPDTQKFNVDDERMLEVYDYMQGKLPLLLHCGDYRYDFSHPRRVARICKLFPDLTVIGAHFGGWSVWEEAVGYLKDTNCIMDTSSSSALTGPELFDRLIHTYGADRLLFGSDFPMWDPADELKRFMRVHLTQSEREKILYKNAAKLLNID